MLMGFDQPIFRSNFRIYPCCSCLFKKLYVGPVCIFAWPVVMSMTGYVKERCLVYHGKENSLVLHYLYFLVRGLVRTLSRFLQSLLIAKDKLARNNLLQCRQQRH